MTMLAETEILFEVIGLYALGLLAFTGLGAAVVGLVGKWR